MALFNGIAIESERPVSVDVIEAINSRKSVRAFTHQPVPRETIEELLTVSQRTPSGTNTQPWHVHVCTGAVRQALSQDVLEAANAGKGGSYEDFDYYPQKWEDIHRDRRRTIGWDLYGLLGIKKGDREASARQGARNFVFFDAPDGLFFTTDRYLGKGSWSDAGMFVQTVMLAARAFGLHTCPQAAWIPYQEFVYARLGIPDTEVLVTGMSLGYARDDAIENTLETERESLDNVATFLGFD